MAENNGSRKIASRRTALKVLGTSAIASGIYPSISGASGSTVEVPGLITGNSVSSYLEVPEDWYHHILQIRKVKNEFDRDYFDKEGIFSISTAHSSEKYGGKNGLQLRVRIDREKFSGSIPSEFRGMPVEIRKKPDNVGLGSYCHNFEANKNVQGGDVGRCKETNSYGTVCCPFELSGSTYLLHCAHVFWDECTKDPSHIEGRTLQGRNFDGTETVDLGVVEYANNHGDWVRINPYYDVTADYTIDDGDTWPDFAGMVSEWWLENELSKLKGSRNKVYNMGVNTGKTEGKFQMFTKVKMSVMTA